MNKFYDYLMPDMSLPGHRRAGAVYPPVHGGHGRRHPRGGPDGALRLLRRRRQPAGPGILGPGGPPADPRGRGDLILILD